MKQLISMGHLHWQNLWGWAWDVAPESGIIRWWHTVPPGVDGCKPRSAWRLCRLESGSYSIVSLCCLEHRAIVWKYSWQMKHLERYWCRASDSVSSLVQITELDVNAAVCIGHQAWVKLSAWQYCVQVFLALTVPLMVDLFLGTWQRAVVWRAPMLLSTQMTACENEVLFSFW